MLNGPQPNAIDDLYTPEINSNADPSIPGPAGGDWTSSEPRVIAYDTFKVNAVVDEINGKSSYCVDEPAKCSSPGTPAIMGMNFQAVSVGQKLPDPGSPRLAPWTACRTSASPFADGPAYSAGPSDVAPVHSARRRDWREKVGVDHREAMAS